MLGVLSLAYSWPYGVEHQALITVLLNFERFLQPLIAAKAFFLQLSVLAYLQYFEFGVLMKNIK